MEKIITIIYALGLVGNSIWKYQSTKDVGSLIFEAVAGLALIPIAISMGSDQLETSFLSYFLALGISFVLVIFFAISLWKDRTIHSIIQLSISFAFFIAGLYHLGGIS
jgi:fucose permease